MFWVIYTKDVDVGVRKPPNLCVVEVHDSGWKGHIPTPQGYGEENTDCCNMFVILHDSNFDPEAIGYIPHLCRPDHPIKSYILLAHKKAPPRGLLFLSEDWAIKPTMIYIPLSYT